MREILDAVQKISAKRLVIDSLAGFRWRWRPASARSFANRSTA